MSHMCTVFCNNISSTSINRGVDEEEHVADNCNVVIKGIITDKVTKNHSCAIYVRGDSEKDRKAEKANYIVYLENQKLDDFFIGQYVEVEGIYNNFSVPENDGQFNMRRYYRIREFDAALKKARVLKVSRQYSKYREFLYSAKNNTKDVFFSNMSEVEAGTLTAMVLGDKTALNDEVKEYYQNAGVAHILSLSGLHIATVGMVLFSGMYRAGLGIKASSIISLVCMTSYGIMTGMSTSTMRALVMFSLGIIAKNIGRTYDLLSAAALSAILILMENPFFIYDSGFLMSFLSIEGIGLLYPVIYDVSDFGFQDKGLTILEKVMQGMCISASASIATLPVVMNCFYKIARYGMLANIIIVPLMTVVLWMGIIAGIIGNVLTAGAIVKTVLPVRCILMIDESILKLYTYVSEKMSGMKGNIWVTGKAGSTQIVIYIMFISLAIVFYSIYKNKAFVILLIGIAVAVLSYRMKPDLSINAVSVGQGACNVIYGKNIPTVVIDGGSTDVKNVGKYRIAPFLQSKGIGEIDYLFISHPDADHVNGIKEIMTDKGMGIQINHIFMSVNDDEIESLANDNLTNFHIMANGDTIRIGKLSVKCIYPTYSEVDESTNDKSLVLILNYDDYFSCLFPGDISAEAEKKIVSSQDLMSINMLSVAHHGSKYSSCEDFLESVTPSICTISSGKGNSYGHPHRETLDRLSMYVPQECIFRTDKSGQITISLDNRVISVRKYK